MRGVNVHKVGVRGQLWGWGNPGSLKGLDEAASFLLHPAVLGPASPSRGRPEQGDRDPGQWPRDWGPPRSPRAHRLCLQEESSFKPGKCRLPCPLLLRLGFKESATCCFLVLILTHQSSTSLWFQLICLIKWRIQTFRSVSYWLCKQRWKPKKTWAALFLSLLCFLFFLHFIYSFLATWCTACGIVVPWTGIEPLPPALKAQS